jgi:2-polyprenyl-3-methyl-5-hydroxy-6-metoxy-1,4-benzoquinol methylase
LDYSLKDDRGYNQVFKPSYSTNIRLERRASYIIDHFKSDENIDVLEIGCGIGIMANMIASKISGSVLGVDLCVPFIETAKKTFVRSNLSFEVMDFNSPEHFGQRRFDYIVGNGILHHLYHNLDNALANIKHLLKPNGRIVFLEPNIYNPYCQLIFKNAYFRKKAALEPGEMAFSKRFINDKLSSLGYENIEIEFKDFLLPGIPRLFVKPSVFFGAIAEKIPIVRMWSQSIYISAQKPD